MSPITFINTAGEVLFKLDSGRRVLGLHWSVDQLPHVQLQLVGEAAELADERLLVRDDGAVDERSAREAVEVVTWVRGGVHLIQQVERWNGRFSFVILGYIVTTILRGNTFSVVPTCRTYLPTKCRYVAELVQGDRKLTIGRRQRLWPESRPSMFTPPTDYGAVTYLPWRSPWWGRGWGKTAADCGCWWR